MSILSLLGTCWTLLVQSRYDVEVELRLAFQMELIFMAIRAKFSDLRYTFKFMQLSSVVQFHRRHMHNQYEGHSTLIRATAQTRKYAEKFGWRGIFAFFLTTRCRPGNGCPPADELEKISETMVLGKVLYNNCASSLIV